MNPDQYCLEKIKASHSNFALAFLFLNKKKRQALNALYAFCREVDDIVDNYDNKIYAKKRLDEWRTEINQLYNNKPQHLISRALLPHIHSFHLRKKYFIEIIDGMEMDININRYDSFKDLELYCYRAASTVGLLSASIFGYSHQSTLKYAKDLGIALQLTNIIRDIDEDSFRGRIYIPKEVLNKFGVTEEDVFNRSSTFGLHNMIDTLSVKAQDFYKSSMEHLAKEDRHKQKPGLIMGNIYFTLLKKITKNNKAKSFEGKIKISSLYKFFIAMTTFFGKTWIN